jgi:hypothetical protein
MPDPRRDPPGAPPAGADAAGTGTATADAPLRRRAGRPRLAPDRLRSAALPPVRLQIS